MPFDIASLVTVQLNELLEDHEADLTAYLTRHVTRERPVTAINGSVYRFETPLKMSANLQRSVKHAPGADTPDGSAALGTRNYEIECFSWQESINHLAKQELEQIPDALETLAGATSHMVLGALDRELAKVLKGQGHENTNDGVKTKAITHPWSDRGVASDPVADVDSVVSELRNGSRGLMAIVGYDVALGLSTNAKVVNSLDMDHVGFDAVKNFFRGRGINEVYIDLNVQQDGEREAARSYTGIFDGVCYIGTADNLILAKMNDLNLDVYETKSKRVFAFRAALDADIITGYREHGYALTGTLG